MEFNHDQQVNFLTCLGINSFEVPYYLFVPTVFL